MITSSCIRWLPAIGTPLRIRSSLPVQHRPTRLMPAAPRSFARATSSGSVAACTTTSDRSGLWPWRATLTWSTLSVPRLTVDSFGDGVPNMTSDSSVAIIEPPQPSARLVRRPWSRTFADLDAPLLGQPPQLGLVGDLIAGRLTLRGRQEDLEDVAAVVRVGRGSGGDRSTEIAGDDQVGVGAADALLWSLTEGIDPARAHRAVPAGHTE